MDDLISRQAALEAIRTLQTYKLFSGDDMILIDKAQVQTELMMLPSAQPEHMHTVMLKIAEKYEKAMNTSCILNPMAWALYQTWKEYDR